MKMGHPNKIKFGFAFPFLLYLLLIPAKTSALDDDNVTKNKSPLSIKAEVDKLSITLGDIVTYSIVIRSDPDFDFQAPDLSDHFKGFDILEKGIQEPKKIDGQIERTFWYRLQADDVGSLTIDPVQVSFKGPDTKNPTKIIEGQVMAPEVKVEVRSLLHIEGEAKDIRDIKSLIDVGRNWTLYIIAAMLALLLLAGGIWYWCRKKETLQQAASPSRLALSPQDQALQELRNLSARQLIELGMVREYYFELSEIFRRYLENRYCFPALDWTTEEISQKLHGNFDMNEPLKIQVCDLLYKMDQVKFAKIVPSESVNQEMYQSIIEFIQSTRPREPQEMKTPANATQ